PLLSPTHWKKIEFGAFPINPCAGLTFAASVWHARCRPAPTRLAGSPRSGHVPAVSHCSAKEGTRAVDARTHLIGAEDEPPQPQLLDHYLGKQNFRVSGADGGVALRKLVERELPTLVMLDVGLPGEDGFALARWLRERSGRIGIIMVTGATDT